MEKRVITISRYYGSGGRLIGRKLAMELGIPFYDRDIIEKASERSGISADYIEKLEERASNSFLFNLVTTAYSMDQPEYTNSLSHVAFTAQANVIRELAERSSCVIVGRCGEYILREMPECVKVLIYADRESRLRRIVEQYKEDPKTAPSKLAKLDKGRSNYYRSFTGENWGDPMTHDLCINSGRCGTDGAVEIIKEYLKHI